ncbi:MAG: c-type cytochrome [Akkermansia muciniphila]
MAHCAVCHGEDGSGRGSMAAYDTYPQIGPFRDEKYASYSSGKMFRSIRLGQGNMPAFGNILTAREIWCLVAFIRHLQAPPEEPAVQQKEQHS